jgi:sortase A
MGRVGSAALLALVLLVAPVVAGCQGGADAAPARERNPPVAAEEPMRAPAAPMSVAPRVQIRQPRLQPSDGVPRTATLEIPRIGVRGLVVVPYRGRPDDAPCTRIQDGGVAASPHGPRGGTGPGGVGNYIVTAHRTSSTRAFADLPRLAPGDRIRLLAGGTRFVDEVVSTRSTSFRSPRSLARQAAAVPGRPGARPTRAMITLSTCATPEDHAVGNFWADEFGNPEHRIDKIGVLVRTAPARR